jgi:restriction system protein
MALWDAVCTVLEQAGEPLHTKDITKRILEGGLWHSEGKTPDQTVAARLYSEAKKEGSAARVVQTGKGTFALNADFAGAVAATPDSQPAGAKATSAPSEAAAVGTAVVKKRLSFVDAAEDVLRRYGHGQPMHYRDITAKVLDEGLVKTSGKTPEATLYAQVITENARAEKQGRQPRFIRHGKGLVSLTESLEPGVQHEIAKHNAAAEEEMLNQLRELDPREFEQLVGHLLRALGIRDVEVTAYHGDKGVDVTGAYDLAPGMNVSIAVQAKRQGNNVGRPVVQSLNGSLKPRQQGLIITTAGFATSARVEAAREDKPLIWLIDGPQFVKLLVANDLGARRVPVELVEPTGFDLGEDDVQTEKRMSP